MSYYAEHEAVACVAVLEAVGIHLPDVAKIANSQRDAPETEVQHQRLPEAECVAWMSTQDVVTDSLLRYLVIALAELRTEHHTQHRQVGLVAGPHRQFPKLELIGCSSRKREVNTEMPLGWIVAIPVVIKETKVCANQRTTLQVEVLQGRMMIVPTSIVGQTSTCISGCLSWVVGRSKDTLKGALEGDVSLGKLGHPLTLRHEAHLQPLVFHWGEVSVELVCLANAYEERPCRRASVRHSLVCCLLCQH